MKTFLNSFFDAIGFTIGTIAGIIIMMIIVFSLSCTFCMLVTLGFQR